MNAEMYANWTLFIAPIVLRGRFNKSWYYKHFLKLVKLLKLCLAFEISDAMLNQIDEGFQLWMEEFEQWVLCVSLPFITLKSIQAVLRKWSRPACCLSFDYSRPSSYCMGYQSIWSCLDILGISHGTSLQHLTTINQKPTPFLCINRFFCHCNCTTRPNTTIVQSPWRAIPGSRRKGKRPCTQFVYVSLLGFLLVTY